MAKATLKILYYGIRVMTLKAIHLMRPISPFETGGRRGISKPFCFRIVLLFILLITALAHAEIAVPPLTARVTDLTNTLIPQQRQTLEQTLQAFEAQKGSQIAVLIVPTTAPETIEQYALRVAETWQLGRKDVDDGALLLVAKDDRALRIEVGYGLEGALNDATAKRIIAEIITPRFKNNDFFGGIQAGLASMIDVVEGEPLPAPQPRGADSGSSGSISQLFPLAFFFALIVAPFLRSLMGRFPSSLVSGALATTLIWFFAGSIFIAILVGVGVLLFSLFSSMSGLGRGGYYGGMGGGLGGGGFSGGGGGFGGGGASGRW